MTFLNISKKLNKAVKYARKKRVPDSLNARRLPRS